MKKNGYLLTTIAILLFSCYNKYSITIDEIQVATPFEMPNIKVPDFSNCKKNSIVDFGVVKGDKNKISSAIENAINKANKLGGGIVVVPEEE